MGRFLSILLLVAVISPASMSCQPMGPRKPQPQLLDSFEVDGKTVAAGMSADRVSAVIGSPTKVLRGDQAHFSRYGLVPAMDVVNPSIKHGLEWHYDLPTGALHLFIDDRASVLRHIGFEPKEQAKQN